MQTDPPRGDGRCVDSATGKLVLFPSSRTVLLTCCGLDALKRGSTQQICCHPLYLSLPVVSGHTAGRLAAGGGSAAATLAGLVDALLVEQQRLHDGLCTCSLCGDGVRRNLLSAEYRVAPERKTVADVIFSMLPELARRKAELGEDGLRTALRLFGSVLRSQ